MSLILIAYAIAGGAIGLGAARALSQIKPMDHIHFVDPARWVIDSEIFGIPTIENSKCIVCERELNEDNIGMLIYSEPEPIEVCDKTRCLTIVQRELDVTPDVSETSLA